MGSRGPSVTENRSCRRNIPGQLCSGRQNLNGWQKTPTFGGGSSLSLGETKRRMGWDSEIRWKRWTRVPLGRVFSTSMSHRLLGNEREAASPVCASARKGCCSSEAVTPSVAAPNP